MAKSILSSKYYQVKKTTKSMTRPQRPQTPSTGFAYLLPPLTKRMISNWEITLLPLYAVLGRVSITVPSPPLEHNPTSQHLVNQALSLKETHGREQLELIHPTNVTMQRPCVHSCHPHPQSCFLRLGSACFCSTVSSQLFGCSQLFGRSLRQLWSAQAANRDQRT